MRALAALLVAAAINHVRLSVEASGASESYSKYLRGAFVGCFRASPSKTDAFYGFAK
jgi:hypothetical protein